MAVRVSIHVHGNIKSNIRCRVGLHMETGPNSRSHQILGFCCILWCSHHNSGALNLDLATLTKTRMLDLGLVIRKKECLMCHHSHRKLGSRTINQNCIKHAIPSRSLLLCKAIPKPWLCLVGRPHFEELSFPVNQPISFSTSDREEFGSGKFSRLFFHLVPNEIHPLALLIPTAFFASSLM